MTETQGPHRRWCYCEEPPPARGRLRDEAIFQYPDNLIEIASLQPGRSPRSREPGFLLAMP